jgi:sugar transferase (PEP-CTERM/EpsH1 system associated)
LKILFLQKRVLFPSDSGGRIRTLNVLRYLARWHEVTYLCNVQPEDEHVLDDMRALGIRLETVPWIETPRGTWQFYRDLAWNLMSPYPFTVDKDYDPALRARAAELLRGESYDLMVCDFVQMARNALGLSARRSILFQHNVEAQLFRRHAASGGSWLRRQYMAHQWRKMRRFEGEAGRRFTAVIAVSEQDQETFESDYGWGHVRAIDTGVDVDYFQPHAEEEREGRVVFVGSMDWLPNQDGVQYFVQHIWPQIRHAQPQAVFQIVGRRPPRSIERLADVDGVQVVGTVPDVRPFLAQAAVVVVPLLVGGGTRIKIFEAMAMSRPVVSTPLGAEGLKVRAGDEIVLAESPEEFAGAVSRLLASRDLRRKIGETARQTICRHFSAETVARQFEAACHDVVASGACLPC